jgi:hypothetical protein
MAEQSKADGSGAKTPAEDSAAAALDSAANGKAAAPLPAAHRDASRTDAGVAATQDDGTPVRTAAEIVAENKAKKAADEAAAKAGMHPRSAGKESTTTSTRPVERRNTAKNTSVPAAGNGVIRARHLLASAVLLIAVLCAAVLALGAVFTALSQTNESNELVSWVLARGEDLAGPFSDLFRLETAKNTLLVNWGIAALSYLILGKVIERVIRP